MFHFGHGFPHKKMYYEIVCVFVWCLLCLIGNTHSISVRPDVSKVQNQVPNRRFYFYNPELLSHAATALGMVVPQAFYKPMAPSLAPVHFADYGGEEEEEIEEHEHEHEHDEKPPIQLFTILKPKKPQKHSKYGKKKKKMKGHQHNHKPLHQFKKYVKKCLPFKVRIIKKSDIDNNDDQFYQNIRTQLPYGYGDEYFPQPPDKQELAVISLNTSNISENGARFPQVLHFLYPRYNIQQPRPKPRIPQSSTPPQPPRKTYRFARQPPKGHAMRPRRPWPKTNPWRVVPPGKPVSKFPLKEPTPDAVGGSPPPSPLLNIYKDPRIPVNQKYVVDEQTESTLYNKVTPNYVYVHPTIPTQIQYYQDQWVKPTEEMQFNGKYSSPDYYRYGTYNQDQLSQENNEKGYISEQNSDQEANYNTIRHSYQNFPSSSEKIVTVTPTTSWVPIPQHHRVIQSGGGNKFRNVSSFENKKVNYMSGGFKNLSSNGEKEGESYKFGDKIVVARNCSTCLEKPHENLEIKQNKRIVISRGVAKYHNKPKGVNPENKYSSQSKKKQNGNAKFYIEEVPVGKKGNNTENKARSYQIETEIVTAKYSQDNLNEVYKYVTPSNLNSVRARRSNFKGFSTVVSGSMQVKEK